MKAILEFSFPDEAGEHVDCLNGWKWKSVVEDLNDFLRDKIKYSNSQPSTEEIRKILFDLLDYHNLTLD